MKYLPEMIEQFKTTSSSALVYWLAWSLISGHEEVKGWEDEGMVTLGAKAETSATTV